MPHPPCGESHPPIVWFFVLEDALDRGDFARAAQAQRELRRLGIHVSYRRPRQARGGVPCA
jgi:hypothetical protein